MKPYNLQVLEIVARSSNPQTVDESFFECSFPNDTEGMLDAILESYERSGRGFVESVLNGYGSAPWALIFLDKHYDFASHIIEARGDGGGIYFTPYDFIPSPVPEDFEPKAGLIIIGSRKDLIRSSSRSQFLASCYEVLDRCSDKNTWMLFPSQEHTMRYYDQLLNNGEV